MECETRYCTERNHNLHKEKGFKRPVWIYAELSQILKRIFTGNRRKKTTRIQGSIQKLQEPFRKVKKVLKLARDDVGNGREKESKT